jgi:Ser-tRNA(Ala) deacylase AlaX
MAAAMTRKVFWEDPYLTTLETRVAGVDGADVRLDASIFYAESGGQESDAGTIGGHPVRAARKAGRDIVYSLDPDHGLEVGEAVTVDIDWPRRFRLMRLHFAAELILELVCRDLAGIEKIGAHIAEDKARIDFAWPEPISPQFPALAAEANDIVDAGRPIESAFSDAAAERRFWKIEGFAAVPCGGTHLRSTAEVGAIRLKRKNIGKGKERIEIYVD